VRAVVVGLGAVGARAARQLVATPEVEHMVVVAASAERAEAAARSLGPEVHAARWDAAALAGADVVVLGGPPPHRALAEAALEAGASVVSVADTLKAVRSLLDLDAEARERGRSVVVGAGFSPGLSCLLARHAASEFDAIEEVHVAKVGTGGPACARSHHHALGEDALDLRDGALRRRRGGSGRELCWFPDPVGARDCYRGGLPEALLLTPALPGATRITARVAATRRDRFTARLPMLRPPHAEGMIGAVRVEVRGRRGQVRDTRVLGVIDRPAVAAGTVAAVAAVEAGAGRLARSGAGGLAEVVTDPLSLLRDLWERGVRAAVFEGASLG
jgi:saccharopine dehydrogenase-like NADP-dependent oxidoreductase